ncbi:MAG: hypothetical protein V1909_04740, partial [Candidatus Micrarchaeota archaeon]
MAEDKVFLGYLNIVLNAFLTSGGIKAVNEKGATLAVFGYAASEYKLLRELGLSDYQINQSAKYSAYSVYKIIRDVREVFLGSEETESIVSTALERILHGAYSSVQAAKTAYDSIHADALRIFGSDPNTENIVRTAVGLVFQKTYSSVQAAKTAYDSIYADAERIFGSDPNTSEIVRTAASLAWVKRYSSVQAVKEACDIIIEKVGDLLLDKG